MTLRAWLQAAYQEFKALGFTTPRAEAEIFASQVLDFPRAKLIAHEEQELSPEQAERLSAGLVRRITGEPLAYVVGFKHFFKSEFEVGPGVLIPRPETELVVELALELREKLPDACRIADFGAGSGCIGLSLILECPRAELVLVENSPEAIKYLVRNLKKLKVENRAAVRDVAVESLNTREFHLVVANPPYIADKDPDVDPHVRGFEPGSALFSDENGLGAIRRWLKVGSEVLLSGGFLIMEIGAGQATDLRTQQVEGLAFVSVHQDLAGHDRVLIWRKS